MYFCEWVLSHEFNFNVGDNESSVTAGFVALAAAVISSVAFC
jgi:hypothetical protein